MTALPSLLMRSIQPRASARIQSQQDHQHDLDPDADTVMGSQIQPLRHPQRLLRLQQVMAKTGVARTFIYDLIKRGRFPMPLKAGRSSLWIEAEIDQWIEALAASRDAA